MNLFDKFEKSNFTFKDITIPYRFYTPENVIKEKKYPLILTLHGAGERGNDNEKQILLHGLAVTWAKEENQKKYPCFILSPQCPENRRWVEVDWKTKIVNQDLISFSDLLITVIELLNEIENKNPVDKNRIYLTGLSMGGFAVWDLITRYPNKFAAAIPMSGGGDPSKVKKIRNIPIWAFHGEKDDVVPVEASRNMVDELRKVDGKIIYSEIPKKGHAIWLEIFNNQLLIDWLFAQMKA